VCPHITQYIAKQLVTITLIIKLIIIIFFYANNKPIGSQREKADCKVE
jgi:hypothetical protein